MYLVSDRGEIAGKKAVLGALAMGFIEIPVGKLVMPLGILRLLVVHPQIPFAVFGKPMEANVFVFLLGGRLMLAPRISRVEHKSSFLEEFSGVLISASVKRHGHGDSPVLSR